MNNNFFKKKLKREKMLLQLKKELAHLEFLMNHYGLVKFQKEITEKLKIAGKGLEYLMPYFLVVTILTGACKLTASSFPFYLDDTKKYLKTIKEFDSSGLVRVDTTYEETNINNNILAYTTSWMKIDTSFMRETKIYNLNILTEENIQSLLKNSHINFEDILGEPIKVSKEYSSSLSDKELNLKPTLKAYLYQEDLNDYIVLEEDESYNLLITIIFAIIAFGATSATYFFLSAKPDYNFASDIQEIMNNSGLSKNDLSKILELKKKNYERLTGDVDEYIQR